MQRLWKGWIAALGVVLLTATVSMAQPKALKKDLADSPSWWSELFDWSSKPPAKPKPVDPKEEPRNKPDKGAVAPEPAAQTEVDKEGRQQRALNAFLRRDAVIFRLQEIALDTNNPALDAEAIRLQEMARAIYLKETNKIRGVATNDTEIDALERGNAVRESGSAIRAASGSTSPARSRGASAESMERSAGLLGGK